MPWQYCTPNSSHFVPGKGVKVPIEVRGNLTLLLELGDILDDPPLLEGVLGAGPSPLPPSFPGPKGGVGDQGGQQKDYHRLHLNIENTVLQSNRLFV